MSIPKPAGPGAAARKYDLLTALGTLALSCPPAEQRLILRLMVAITARYNWTSDLLAVAQVDLARMWSVDERTVKRSMAEFRSRGWLRLKRQAARGRVAEYGLGFEALMNATRTLWSAVGSDFEQRLAPPDTPAPGATVVPFPLPAAEGTLWPQALRLLVQADPVAARTWMQGLRDEGTERGCLRLVARGRYQASYLRTHLQGRLLAAVQQVDNRISALSIEHDGA